MILLFILALFITAYVHNNNIAYIVMFFTFSVLFISFIFGRKNLKNIDIKLISSDRLFANKKANLKAIVSGRGFDLNIEDKHIDFLKDKEIIEFSFFPKKRGVYKIEKIFLSSRFPLGIVEFIRDIEINKEFIIYPEIKGKSLDEAKSIGFDEEFSGIRKYKKGDKLSQIYWPSLAKGTLVSKEFNAGEDNKKKELIFDMEKIKGDIEFKLSQLTKWIIEAEKKGIDFKVKINGKVLKGEVDEILKILATY